jgi:hypothetical protein
MLRSLISVDSVSVWFQCFLRRMSTKARDYYIHVLLPAPSVLVYSFCRVSKDLFNRRLQSHAASFNTKRCCLSLSVITTIVGISKLGRFSGMATSRYTIT